MKIIGFFQPIGYEITSQLLQDGLEVEVYDFQDLLELSELEEEMILSIGRNANFTYQTINNLSRNNNETEGIKTIVCFNNEIKNVEKYKRYLENIPPESTLLLFSEELKTMVEKNFKYFKQFIIPPTIAKWMKSKEIQMVNPPVLASKVSRHIINSFILSENKSSDGNEIHSVLQEEVEEVIRFNNNYHFLK